MESFLMIIYSIDRSIGIVVPIDRVKPKIKFLII